MGRLLFVLVLVLCIGTIDFSWCKELSSLHCIERERIALLKFKQSLTDASNRLSSWVGEECCSWEGVGCNNTTRHVTKIDLRNPYPYVLINDSYYDATYSKASLVGSEVNPSLLELKYLNYLDLSWNNFSLSEIPKFFGSFRELRYLNLSCACFSGKVPYHLGNLSALNFLDLSIDQTPDFGDLRADNLHWLSHLSSLQYLGMSKVNLSEVYDWVDILNVLPSLSELHLSHCGLSKFSPSFPNFNLTNLVVLDLSWNDIQGDQLLNALPNMTSLELLRLSGNMLTGPIPKSVGKLSKLRELDLALNRLSGTIPESIGQLNNLNYLNLGVNSFSGLIPISLGNMSMLRELDLSSNSFNGSVPVSIGQLSELRTLLLSYTSFKGFLSEDHFAKLSRLESLDMGRSSLALKVGSQWVPPFQLKYADMSSCKLGPEFPAWLQTQSQLTVLYLSNTSISASMPNWFGNVTSNLQWLDLSHNQIRGRVPNFLTSKMLSVILLSSNNFEGPLPHFPSNVIRVLDLSNNSISGTIPLNIGDLMPSLQLLYLSNNHISGSIPNSVCQMEDLKVLHLSKNRLFGNLPLCWTKLQHLQAINLASNDLSGFIPSSIGNLNSLFSLHLSNNSFQGELPLALKNCRGLDVLDISWNNFSGNIPIWIGENLRMLQILNLRSNMFDGNIPSQLCHLSRLQIMNIAQNNLSGSIPHCLGNIKGMILGESRGFRLPDTRGIILFEEQIVEIMRGRESEYDKILETVINLDLSNNNLIGGIPEELTLLSGLKNMNLSRNHLTGSIPENIGNLSSLESLDFSKNKLSGSIPQSMSDLTYLSHLDFSYNNLSGRIPSGNQLQTLIDPSSIFKGNTELCGDLIEKKCPEDEPSHATTTVDEEGKNEKDESKVSSFYIGMTSGFVTGFWGFCGVLLFKKSWRYAYFKFMEDMKDMLIVAIVVRIAWLRKKLKCNQVEE